MATVRVEVFKSMQQAATRKLQLEDPLMGFEVSEPQDAQDVVWDATNVTGREDGAPDSAGTVWVIVARKV